MGLVRKKMGQKSAKKIHGLFKTIDTEKHDSLSKIHAFQILKWQVGIVRKIWLKRGYLDEQLGGILEGIFSFFGWGVLTNS